MATPPEIFQLGGELLGSEVSAVEMDQCAYDFLHPLGCIAQDIPILLELRLGVLRLLPIGRIEGVFEVVTGMVICLLYTSPSPRDRQKSRMPSSA